jgi:hypothetical protein
MLLLSNPAAAQHAHSQSGLILEGDATRVPTLKWCGHDCEFAAAIQPPLLVSNWAYEKPLPCGPQQTSGRSRIAWDSRNDDDSAHSQETCIGTAGQDV